MKRTFIGGKLKGSKLPPLFGGVKRRTKAPQFVRDCPRCGAPLHHTRGAGRQHENSPGGSVSWFFDWHCASCGYRDKADILGRREPR